jgi:hypothetical protein
MVKRYGDDAMLEAAVHAHQLLEHRPAMSRATIVANALRNCLRSGESLSSLARLIHQSFTCRS